MSLTKVVLNLDAYGMGKVLVDGIDMAKYATAVYTQTKAGSPTVVEIEYLAEVGGEVIAENIQHRVLLGPFLGKGATVRAAVEDALAQMEAA